MNLDVLILQKNSNMDPCLNLMTNSNSVTSNITIHPKVLNFAKKKLDLIINFNF